ncbi:hypothetical protein TARUN_7798 [Trichoderma arundinaceum]|uniref:DUF5071 domain-containing protein n=1 Tax=Trichoderma arundinaceum TaxID=490622 RepID=A0A395NFE4_TRIAR|nr:hypothetical protein TARUN_7798 [Trichoderma arundinaceum]
MVKFGFGACIPAQRSATTCTITAYPAASKRLLGTRSTCSILRLRAIPRAKGIMTSSQLQQIEAVRWSREALDEAIGRGSLDHVLRWVAASSTNAAEEDAAANEDQISKTRACKILIERAGEPTIIHGISSVLSRPITTRDGFFTACAGVDGILSYLPLATLRLYKSALEALISANTGDSPPGVSVPSLTSRAKDAVKFVDHPDLAWAPQHKFDFMGERSLAERVHSAEQMKPHASELLGWLADYNWPPCSGCIEQLARFPEVAVGPIKEIIPENGNDPEWLLHIVEFVEEYVPVGQLWQSLEPELTMLANSEAEDEENRELAEAARRLLDSLREWRTKQGVRE